MTLQKLLVPAAIHSFTLPRHQSIGKYALILSDGVAFLLAAILANMLHWLLPIAETNDFSSLWAGPMAQDRLEILAPLFLCALIWFLLLGHYTRRRPFWDEFAEIIRVLLVLAAIDASLLYITKLPFSRLWFIGAWVGAVFFVPILRILVKTLLLKLSIWQKPAIILGTGPNAIDAVAALRSERLMGYEIEAFATPTARAPDEPRTLRVADRQIPIVHFDPARVDDLRALSNTTVVVAFEQPGLERAAKLIARLNRYCDDLHVVPPMRGLPLFGAKIHYYFRHELFFLTLGNNLASPGPRAFKRLFDVVFATGLLLLCLPLFAILAIRIQKDGGPLFFAHKRIGHKGISFHCLKFRTMVPNAQAVLDRLLERDSAALEEWNRDFKLRDDPRITPVGRFLRKYSLDELPQLWNVLKGEMSLVGPRPIVESELERYGEDAEYYLETKPGMSGLWQISGRNDTGYEERVYLDTWYAKNWSLWMDIVILIKTARVVLRKEGAY